MISGQINKNGYYLLYLFMTGLFLGILFVNMKHDVWVQDDGLLNAAMLNQIQNSEWNNRYLFGYIVKHRVFTIFIVSMVASTMIGLPIVCGYACYLGVSAGCILSIAVIRYGIRGLFLMAASIFPQGFLLIPGYFLLLMWGIDCNRSLYGKTEGLEGRYFLNGKQFLLRKGIRLFWIFVVILSGCAVESYVNPKVIQFILKIF
ncbi:MAG: stage II sporulation protein M [Blautia sp.]|nr:stage II sporulation protein M [Lachnoclostridium sp.]MCM1210651.1 stage II sporulation protein M [Blautia sp.]